MDNSIQADVQDATLARFNRAQDRIAKDQGYGATVGALGVTKAFLGVLIPIIEGNLKGISPKDPLHTFAYVVRTIPVETLGVATLSTLLGCVAHALSLTRTAEKVGAAIQAECWAEGLLEHDSKLAKRIERSVRKRHASAKYRKQAARSLAALGGYRAKAWSPVAQVRAGGFLLNCALEALPHVFTVEDVQEGRKTVKVLRITDAALEIAEKAVEEAVSRYPVFLPATEPLAPWTGFRTGGYWDERERFSAPLVRTSHKATVAVIKGAMRAGAMEPHIRAVNTLQAVPWVINRHVLEVVKWAYENNVSVKGIPSKADALIPERLSEEQWNDETTRRLHRSRISKIKERNRDYKSNRILFAQDMATAEKLGNEQFYTPVNCDWRGRVYAVPHFNFARDDRVRALFLFANGMPIGEEGLWWLKVHVANCGDFDKISKRSLEERVEWTTNNITRISEAALSPKGGLWWTQADKPFLFLAACLELTSATAARSSFTTCLPLSFDGSCSGLQHLCAMTRAQEGSLVNLTPSKVPQDVYQTVAGLVNARVTGDITATATEPELVTLAGQVLDYGITRGLVKRNVMTYAYSSKKFGMAQQQVEDLMRPLAFEVLSGERVEHPFGEDEGRAAAKYLAGHVYAAIEEVVEKPAEAMAFLQRCARALAHEGKPISWTTPTGLPWVNRYHAPVLNRVQLWLSDTPVTLLVADGREKEIDKDKVANGVAPNFVHAMDASHLLLTVNACAAEGITNIATVHDSFGCLAPQAKRFNEIIRETFVSMYEQHDVLAEVLEAAKRDLTVHNWQRLPMLPAKGPLNIKEVLNAKYCFA